MELGRMGRKVIRSGPVLLGGEKEEVGDYTGGDPPWGVSILSYTLGAPALRSNMERCAPLAGWRADGTN